MQMTRQHTLFPLMKQKHATWYQLELGFIYIFCFCFCFSLLVSGFIHFSIIMQPLPTKLVLRKKRAKEGRAGDEFEHFPIPSRVTVRRRSTVSVVELQDEGVFLWSYWVVIKFLVQIYAYH